MAWMTLAAGAISVVRRQDGNGCCELFESEGCKRAYVQVSPCICVSSLSLNTKLFRIGLDLAHAMCLYVLLCVDF
jgi:hypothetical protein